MEDIKLMAMRECSTCGGQMWMLQVSVGDRTYLVRTGSDIYNYIPSGGAATVSRTKCTDCEYGLAPSRVPASELLMEFISYLRPEMDKLSSRISQLEDEIQKLTHTRS
jgi:hypothetical protein